MRKLYSCHTRDPMQDYHVLNAKDRTTIRQISYEKWKDLIDFGTDQDDWLTHARIGHWEKDGVEVSTVFFGDGPHIIVNGERKHYLFETVIFGGAMDLQRSRYQTAVAARRGHVSVVEKVKNSQKLIKRRYG